MPFNSFLKRCKSLRITVLSSLICGLLVVAPPAFADELQDWQKKVSKKVAAKHVYPRAAIAREIEGSARVAITIARSGEIMEFEIETSSGQPLLDKAIPKIVKRLSPLPAPPESLPDNKLKFIIPLTWSLS